MTPTLALCLLGGVLALGVLPAAWSAWRARGQQATPPTDDDGARLVALLQRGGDDTP